MATTDTVVALPRAWTAIYTGPGEVQIETNQDAHYAFADGDAEPAAGVVGFSLKRGVAEAITVNTAETLWVRSVSHAQISWNEA